MGNKTCCPKSDDDHLDERSPLLGGDKTDAVTTIQPNLLIRPVECPDDSLISEPQPQSEQSQLGCIVNNLDKKVIDISASETMRISSSEYMDRVALYKEKLSNLPVLSDLEESLLPSASDDPVGVLSQPLMPYSEILQVQQMSQQIVDAYNEIQIKSDKPLFISIAEK